MLNQTAVPTSTFRKAKAKVRHADSTVKVFGHWESKEQELAFESVREVYANMSNEYHLLVTLAGNMLTVTALEERMDTHNDKKVRDTSFTQYQWSAGAEGWRGTPVGHWSIVERQHIMSKVG